MSYPIVWALDFFGVAQSIRREGPKTHQAKAGTPTMGGLGFVVTLIAFAVIFSNFEFDPRYLALILLISAFALIGLIDDALKVIRKKNLGLTFWQKIFFQGVAAGTFSAFLVMVGHHLGVGGVMRAAGFAAPAWYFFLSLFIIVGGANACNLTDGLNGLLAGTAAVAFLSFGFLAGKFGLADAAAVCFSAAGAIAAFLPYNFPRARVFMGDVGSLAVGAALAGMALLIHQEIALAVIGGVFVLETLSVIFQVTGYKLFKKRMFKMTPLHHHFELTGHKETAIVIGFWIAAVIFGVLGVVFTF